MLCPRRIGTALIGSLRRANDSGNFDMPRPLAETWRGRLRKGHLMPDQTSDFKGNQLSEETLKLMVKKGDPTPDGINMKDNKAIDSMCSAVEGFMRTRRGSGLMPRTDRIRLRLEYRKATAPTRWKTDFPARWYDLNDEPNWRPNDVPRDATL